MDTYPHPFLGIAHHANCEAEQEHEAHPGVSLSTTAWDGC